MQYQVLTQFTAIRRAIEGEPKLSKRPGIFKRWIASQVNDRYWSMLILEFKLYVLRRPPSRQKLLQSYDSMRRLSGGDFIEVLFGENLDKPSRAAIERRLTLIGAILGAVVLESHLRPKLLTKPLLQPVLEDLCDALLHT